MAGIGESEPGDPNEAAPRRLVQGVADDAGRAGSLLLGAANSHGRAAARLDRVVNLEGMGESAGTVQSLVNALGAVTTSLTSLRAFVAMAGQEALHGQGQLTEATALLESTTATVWGDAFADHRGALGHNTDAILGLDAADAAIAESGAEGYARKVVGLQVELDPIGATLAHLRRLVAEFTVSVEDVIAEGQAAVVPGLEEAAAHAEGSSDGLALYARGLPGGEPPSPGFGIPLGPDQQ